MKRKLFFLNEIAILSLLIFISGFSIVSAGTEAEPNNLLGLSTPLTIGENFTGTIEPAGDVDFYKVALTTPGRLTCSITNPPANLRIYLHLYNRNADYMWQRIAAINDGDEVFLTTDILDPGTYFVKIEDTDRDTSDQAYNLTAAFISVVDPAEPNNEIGKASVLTGTPVSGTIFDRNDKDYFSIYAKKDDVLDMTVTSPLKMTSYLELYNSNLAYIWVRDGADNPGDLLNLTHTITEDGVYYIRVRDSKSNSMTAPYTLSVTGGSPGSAPVQASVTNEVESNDEFKESNLIDVDTSVTGAISLAGDQDWYKINIPSTGKLKIALTQVPGNIQPVIRLYNHSKAQLLSGQPTDPGDLVDLLYNITAPGIYYIQLYNIDNQALSAETYEITTTLTRVNDIFEPNNDYGDAKLLNAQNRINAYIFSNNDPDWYKINVQQAGDLKIILNNLPKNILPGIDLYDLSKSRLAGKTGMTGVDLELSHPITTPGSYLIKIRGASGNESTAPYTLTIFGAAFTSFAPTASIDRIDPGSIVVTDNIDFTGSGTDADGSITGYSWRSDIDGPLSTAATFSTTSLSLGTHTIYFKVQDNDEIWSTETSEVVYVGSSVSDETEPNDSLATADEIALARPVNAKINEAGDYDYYKVYIPGPGHVTLSATNVPENLRLYLELYNRHYDYLWIRAAAASEGDDVVLEFDCVEPGFYFLRLSDNHGEFKAEFTYTLTLAQEPVTDTYEPNNSRLDAYLLNTGTVDAFIFPGSPDDYDWYKVWMEKDATLTVDITQTPSNLRPYIELYDRNGSYMWVRSFAENDGDLVNLSHVFDTSGYVYIRVRDYDGDYNWTEKYQMTISGAVLGHLPSDPAVTSENEENGEISSANLILPNTSVMGTIGLAGDLDWFRINVPSPCLLTADLTNMAIRGRLRIYDDIGNQIAYREATNPGDDLLIETPITQPGTYRIMIDGPGGGISTLPYNLKVSFTFAVDTYEPNDLFGDSTPLNVSNSITALIFKAGDRDFYRVTSEAGQTLKVALSDVPGEIRPKIDIYNLNYQNVAAKTATNNGQELILSYLIPETNFYFIRISDVGDNSFSTKPYSLTINGALFKAYNPVAIIDSALPNPAQESDAVTLTGHGEDTDGTISGYSWRSSIDGPIGDSGTITPSALTVGIHDMHFKVMDNDGNWSRETKTRLYFGMPAPQETEPNDSIGEANPIEFATQYAGVITPKYDKDYFMMRVPGPGILTISAANPQGSLMRTYLETYHKNADYSWVRASATNPGDPITLQYIVDSSGDYFLKVSDANSTVDSTYTFSVTFTPAPDPFEPNNDAWRSTQISPNEIVQAYIFPQSDKDWYQVTVDTPGTLSLSLTNMPSNLRGYIETYNQNLGYSWVRANALNDGEDVFISYDLALAGTYWIKISDNASHYNASEPYTFTSSFTPAPDTFEPNNIFGSAVLLSKSPVEAYIFPKNDADWYSFYAVAGAVVTIKGDTLPPGVRLNLQLYNSNNGYLWKEAYSAASGDDVELTYTIPGSSSGFYYLKVTGRDATYTAGDTYRLSITGANLASPPIAQPAIVESESNNDFNIANRIGLDPVTGSLAPSNDYDWYYIPVTSPGILKISLIVPSSVRSGITIYNGNKGQVANRDAESKGDASVLNYNIPEAGNWYVRIRDLDNSQSADTYTLDLDFTPVTDTFEPNPDYAQAQLTNLGKTVQAMIFPAGDHDWYKYEVTQAGILQFNILQVPGNMRMAIQVYDENNGQKLHYIVKNNGDPLLTSLRVDTPGTYYVHVYADNGAFSISPYALKVLLSPLEDFAEPNNSFSDATKLAAQNQASGLIFPTNDEDWYSFIVDTPGLLRVQMAQTQGIEPVIILYNDSKNEIKRLTAKNQGDDLLLQHTLEYADRYYLRVYDNGGNNISQNPFVITIEGGSFTKYYPMASIDSLSANPALIGDTVTLTGSGTDQDGTIKAYEWSSSRDGILGYTAMLSITTLTMGDHSIGLRVQDDQGNWSAIVYQNQYITDKILHESEVNNDISGSNPVALNTWITGTIQPKYEKDFYKIYVPERGYVKALVDAVPPGMKSYIEFYNENQDYMWTRNSAINPQDMVLLSFYAEPGWYYAKISDNASGSYAATYGLRFTFTSAPDPYEPNDLRSTATAIVPDGVINDAIISRSNDADFYRVNIPGPGRLSLSLTQVPDKMTGYIELYNPNLDYMWVRNSANHPGEDVSLSTDITSPGNYYIRITDTSGNGHTTPYTFSYDFVPVKDVYEDNPDFGRSVLMPKDSITAVIFPGGDQDWFKVYAQKDDVLSLSVTGIPGTMRPYINMYNRDNGYMWVRSEANNNGDPVYLQYTATESSFYYVKITDSNNGSYLAPYTLTITGGSTAPAENPKTIEVNPNGIFGDATLILKDTNISGTIDPEDDHDWYKVYINSPGVLEISHTGIPAEVTSKMWVYNFNKGQIGYRVATNPGEDNILTITVMTPGLYYIRVADDGDNNFATQSYTLRVNHSPVVDVHEPNMNYGSATPLGQNSVTGYLFDKDDEDWYRVYVRTPGMLSLSLTDVPQDLRPRLRLYNAEKSEKGTWVNTNAGVGGDDLVSYDVPAPGFYFIRVYDEADGYSTSSYTLSLTGADFSTAPLLSPIGDRTIDQGVYYGFTIFATDPDNMEDLVFSATNLPPGAVFDPETRTFSWTPAPDQTGAFTGIQFTVSDTVASDSEAITITVTRINQPPVLSAIGNKTIPAETTLSFTLAATDPDLGDTLTFSAANLPTGAVFTAGTKTFTWMPTENQGGEYKDILFTVTDGFRTDFEYIDVTVTGAPTIPTVTTGTITNVSQTGASVAGEVVSDGTADITERGIVYGTSADPTVDGPKMAVDGKLGTFLAVLTGLNPSTLYHVRAYAVNVKGVAYGKDTVFTTLAPPLYPPTVETVSATDVQLTSAIVSGKIISNGGTPITERGFVYDTAAGPTVAAQKIIFTGLTDLFSMTLSSLNQGTKYFARAYAVNKEGTAYGDDLSFTTQTGIPDISAGQAAYDFGNVEMDTASAPFTLIVENKGTAVLNIGAIALSGTDAAQFAKQNDACSNQALVPLETKTIQIIFSPTASGDKAAVLTIPSNDPDTPSLAIQLTGKGLEEAILKGDINASGDITMADVLLALKAGSGKADDTVKIAADVNDDKKIGVYEAIYDIQGLGGLRQLKDMTLESSQFEQDQTLPEKYTEDGENVSPPLTWSNPPVGTQSFVLVMEDPDSVPLWDHWIVYNIPASTSSFQENAGASGGANLPADAIHGINSFETGNNYYRGPSPPEGSGPHKYIFTLYALSVADLNPTATTKNGIAAAMAGKILSQVSLTGIYARKAPFSEGSVTLKSRNWNDNDGLKFSTGAVVAVGECYPDCTTMDFYVETNIVFLGNHVLAQDLGEGTSLATTTQVPASGYNITSQDILYPQTGRVFAFLLPDRTFGMIEFTQIAVADPTNGDITYCTVKYKYQPDGTTQF